MASEAPGDLGHPFLQFDGTETVYQKRLDVLWPRRHQMLARQRLDFAVLKSLYQRKRWDEIVCGLWLKLLRIHQVQHVELVMEFFSTYEFAYPSEDLNDDHAIRFRLGGRWRKISVARLGEILGLYTPDEIDSELFVSGITEFPSEEVKKQFWSDHGVGTYNPSATRASKLRDPLLRILHRCLVYSISGRGNSEQVVNLRDLFYLYCLVQPHACNLALVIADFLTNSTRTTAVGAIFGGHFVTKIAKAYKLLTVKAIAGLTPVAETELMTLRTLQSMHMIRDTPVRKRLVDQWNRIWNPIRPGPDPDRAQTANHERPVQVTVTRVGVDPAPPPPPPPPPQPQEVVIPLSERRMWAWMYETYHAWAAAAAVAGIHVQILVPFFMQPPIEHVQQTPDGDLGGMDLDDP